MNALLKGLLTATVVWLVMLAARRLGGRCAGLLTGLPTVTGPALLWMTLDHGAAYANLGAAGAIAATIACALFARVYVWAGTGSGVLRAVTCATAATAAGLALARCWTPSLAWAIPVATFAVLVLQRLKFGRKFEPPQSAGASPLLTAGVAGAITALLSLGCGSLSAQAAGAASSLPVIAAAVAVREHRLEGPAAARCFLDGYLDGLLGRIMFTAAFGLLVLFASWPVATVISLLLSTAFALVAPRLRRVMSASGFTQPSGR